MSTKAPNNPTQWHAPEASKATRTANATAYQRRTTQAKADERALYGSLTSSDRQKYTDTQKAVRQIQKFSTETALRTQWWSMDPDARSYRLTELDELAQSSPRKTGAGKTKWKTLESEGKDVASRMREMHEANWAVLMKRAEEKHAPATLSKDESSFVALLGVMVGNARATLNHLFAADCSRRSAEWLKRPETTRRRLVEGYADNIKQVRRRRGQSRVTQIWDDLEACIVQLRKDSQELQRLVRGDDCHDPTIDNDFHATQLDEIPVNTVWMTETRPSGLSPTFGSWSVEDLVNLQRRVARCIDAKFETLEQFTIRAEKTRALRTLYDVSTDEISSYQWKHEPTRNTLKYDWYQAEKTVDRQGQPGIRQISDPGPNNAQLYNMNQKLQNDHQRVMTDPASLEEAKVPAFLSPLVGAQLSPSVQIGTTANQKEQSTNPRGNGKAIKMPSRGCSSNEPEISRQSGPGTLITPANAAEAFNYVPDFIADQAPRTLFSEMMATDDDDWSYKQKLQEKSKQFQDKSQAVIDAFSRLDNEFTKASRGAYRKVSRKPRLLTGLSSQKSSNSSGGGAGAGPPGREQATYPTESPGRRGRKRKAPGLTEESTEESPTKKIASPN